MDGTSFPVRNLTLREDAPSPHGGPRQLIDIARLSKTLLLAIHQLGDAERICDRFILLSAGRIRGYGTLDELRARTRLPGAHLEEIFLALT
jgi:ABC-type multidrug transport system ATPase subunit